MVLSSSAAAALPLLSAAAAELPFLGSAAASGPPLEVPEDDMVVCKTASWSVNWSGYRLIYFCALEKRESSSFGTTSNSNNTRATSSHWTSSNTMSTKVKIMDRRLPTFHLATHGVQCRRLSFARAGLVAGHERLESLLVRSSLIRKIL